MIYAPPPNRQDQRGPLRAATPPGTRTQSGQVANLVQSMLITTYLHWIVGPDDLGGLFQP